jgi:hypothetical protein
VLVRPQRLPSTRPFGPQPQQLAWTQSASALDYADQLLADAAKPLSQKQKQAVLDVVYFTVVNDLEQTISRATDTPLKHSSTPRASPPIIKWVRAKHKVAKARSSWKSLEAPLRWLRNRLTDISYSIHHQDHQQLVFGVAGLQDAPEEFQEVESLKQGLLASQRLGELLISDSAAGTLAMGTADDAIGTLIEDLDKSIDSERSKSNLAASKAWASWVQTSLQGGVGWAHRWSRNLEAWKPASTFHRGQWSGRPSRILEGEAERLASIWDTQTRTQPNPVPGHIDDRVALGLLTGETVQAAAKSFPPRTASTWDGVHPHHVCQAQRRAGQPRLPDARAH